MHANVHGYKSVKYGRACIHKASIDWLIESIDDDRGRTHARLKTKDGQHEELHAARVKQKMKCPKKHAERWLHSVTARQVRDARWAGRPLRPAKNSESVSWICSSGYL